jgi:molybdopterin-guanine dinucleotide biosynthesis protein A
MSAGIAIAILAGGRATRLARKLERPIAGKPMLHVVYEHALETGWPVYIVGSAPFLPDVPAKARTIDDASPGGGPLQAFVAACETLVQPRVFALAADEPHVDAQLLADLASAWVDGDEAVVPQHEDGSEPLAALYERVAVLREAPDASAARGSMHALLARLRVRHVHSQRSTFANVNTQADYDRLQREFA